MNLSSYAKAISGGLTTAIVSELARFGFHPKGASVSAAGVIVTAVVGYVLGHVVVWFTPNKAKTPAVAKTSATK